MSSQQGQRLQLEASFDQDQIPRVSIVIPCLNRTEFLFETLESVKIQTSSEWECIVVDDGSSESHLLAVSRWLKDDGRFRLIRREGKSGGACVCRNMGWRSSRADLVIFLDSDDLLGSKCIENRLSAVEKFQGHEFFVFSTMLFEKRPGDLCTLVNVLTTEDPVSRFLKMDVMWLASGVLWHKSVLERLGGWDENLLSWQDWDISLRALLDGCPYRYVSSVDNYWRVQSPNRESIGQKAFTSEHIRSHEYLIDKLCTLLRDNPQYLRLCSYLYFWIATKWITYSSMRKAVTAWKKAKAGLLRREYLPALVILVLCAVFPFKHRLFNFLSRHNYPGPQLWKGCFTRVIASDSTSVDCRE